MGIEIIGDLDFLKKKSQELIAENERRLEAFCSDAVTEIGVRTRRGKNANDNTIGRYSKGYANYRKSVGRDASTIELNLTGNMLKAMTYTVARRGKDLVGLIFFNNTTTTSPKGDGGGGQTYTSREAARGSQKRFNWFGLSTSQKRKLNNTFRGKNDRRR